MPIIDRRDRNNWYNSIRTTDASGGTQKRFSASQLKGNEIQWGDAMLAKIPQIPGRISRKNVKTGYGDQVTKYVELILERTYDKEKKQTRNKRVTIGIDISHIFEGMMIINDNYHQYFDREGRLTYRSETLANLYLPPKAQPKAGPEQEPDSRTAPKLDPELVPKPDPKPTPEPNLPDKPAESVITIDTDNREDPTESEEEDDREIQEELNQREHEKDHLKFLEGMLQRYADSIQEQAKKRPDKQLSRYQLRRINEVLRELKDFFSDTDVADYLELAEEPAEDGEDENILTYADMEILLHAYTRVLDDYWFGKLWYK